MNEIEQLFDGCTVDVLKEIDNFKNNCKIDKEYLLSVHNNTVYNNVICDYFNRLIKEDGSVCKELPGKIHSCNKVFAINKYDINQVKDFISTNLCHNKFCNNCKKVKQACRMSRYIPELEPYASNMYHIVFTLPNVNGSCLKSTLKKMSKCFSKLMKYINGVKKLSFIDFNKYGYKGCVRSLEITFKDDLYHPHYHTAFAFTNLNLDKTIENTYSYDFYHNRENILFSEFEIILQKIWYLLINDITVNKTNYDNLDLGYSVICNKFEDNDYAELFKYMTKETDEIDNILTYDNFKVLYYSTKFLKQIQGYGVFYRITDEDLEEEIDKIYTDIINILDHEEKPILSLESPRQLLNDDNYTLVSRKKIYQYLKDLDKK